MTNKSKKILILMIACLIIYYIGILIYFNIININDILADNKSKPPVKDDPVVHNHTNISSSIRDNLWLQTDGDRIEFGNGTSIIFRGVSIYDPYNQKFYAKWNFSTMMADCKELAQNWHVNIIRIPVFPDVWYKNQENITQALDMIINAANSNGLYVIIDWHAAGNPVTGKPMTNYPAWDPSIDNAKKFWDFVSERYKDNPMILYSIFNEPGMGITWSQWRPLAETLVSTIRSHNPEALVMVSGVKYAYDLSGISSDLVDYPNIVYETHIYPQSITAQEMGWDASHAGLTGKYPVIVGELGFTPDASPNYFAYGTAENYGKPLFQFMNARNYSWIAWAWSPWLGQPSMLASRKPGDYQRTEYGDFVYIALNNELHNS